MSLFDWFANRPKAAPLSQEQQQREIADGLWTKCPACGALTYTKDLHLNNQVCPECGYHHPVSSQERIKQLMDADTWQPI
ncbi:MAG: hypothetical protein Q6K14_10555, partial [Gloeomargarita sp. GMQP_bins_44]